jgi:murein DD-endopeptidase MepM/ murein hydrolase activator NlpD
MAEKLRNRLTKVGLEQYKEGVEFKKILILMRTLFDNWEERNKFLAKRFFIRKWFMQVKRLNQRGNVFENALKVIDKKLLANAVTTIADIGEIKKVEKAATVARAVDFFTQLRKIWGDWDKIRRRILNIMGKYLESEEEKRMNYLKRKLLQWKDNAKKLTKEAAKNRIAKWTENKYKTAIARYNWKELSNKYDMYVNKSYLFQLKTRLRNWLKLRDMAEKLRNRFTIVGLEQYKEGVEFKKILILMRTLFDNWEERNKFLAKRFFIRKWFMQVKRLKQRDLNFGK